MDRFENNAEINAEKAEQLRCLSGVKLLHVRNELEKILELIGKNGIFEQYTKHNISHIDEMLKMLDWLIPNETKNKLTLAEWMMLVLAVYFHDLGMFVSKKEYESRMESGFCEYKRRLENDNLDKEFIEKVKCMQEPDKFLYQEFVRKNHAYRVRKWILGDEFSEFGNSIEIASEVNKLLENIDPLFREDLGLICESHHLNNLDDITIYNPRKRYGSSDEEVVNLQYIAVILRTADLLHITMDRTPAIEYRLICPSDPISIIEWQKQMAIRAVAPKKMFDEKDATKEIQSNTIEITAYFQKANQAESFFSLMEYIKYVKGELKNSYDLVQNSIKKHGTINYIFPWLNIDDEGIKTKEFERKLLKFELDQNNILQMLVGHTLYNDSSVVLRELVQNGLDAIKFQNELEKNNNEALTAGQINIYWDDKSRELTFIDNGTGMTVFDIENYLLKVGASKYSTKEFKREHPHFVSISRFGIGILTCFLVANDIEIMTCSCENGEANLITLRNVDGKYLLKKVRKDELFEEMKKHGTAIKLRIREDVSMDNLYENISKWILFPCYDVYLHCNKDKKLKIGFNSPKEAIEEYIKQGGVSNNEEIVVKEETIDGITMAYALRYSKYMQEYTLVEYNGQSIGEKAYITIPIGICFEGIRVSSNTPGYEGQNFIAILNSKDNKLARTNVARSSVEDNEQKKGLLKTIYSIYREFVRNQIDNLANKGYSLSWIASEVRFIVNPIFNKNFNEDIRSSIENVKILESVFDEIKGIVFERNNERLLVSPRYIQELESITIIESNMVNAAEYLLRETRTNLTLSKLVGTLQENKEFDNDRLLCNFSAQNVLHREALRGKNVDEINIYREERRIDLVYRKVEDKWLSFDLLDRDSMGRYYDKVFIPNSSSETIKGLEGEFGINSKQGVFLSFAHPLTKYIISKINEMDFTNSKRDLLLTKLFLSLLVNRKLAVANNAGMNMEDANQFFYLGIERDLGRRISGNIMEELWKRINREELISKIFITNNTIYDTADWSRHNAFDY